MQINGQRPNENNEKEGENDLCASKRDGEIAKDLCLNSMRLKN